MAPELHLVPPLKASKVANFTSGFCWIKKYLLWSLPSLLAFIRISSVRASMIDRDTRVLHKKSSFVAALIMVLKYYS